jgi:predicted transcriptional regulator
MAAVSLSLRVPEKTKNKLDALAKASRLPRSVLASEAIAEFVDREAAIRRGIEKAQRELRAGKGIPHGQVMASLDRTIKRASQKRRG